MPTYTNVFGGTVVYPAEVSFRAVSLTADTELSWPTELATNTNVVSKIMNVTATAGPWDLTMPAANAASVGETALIFNVGSNAFVVTDNGGNTIVSIAPGLAYQIFLTDNTTVNGTWSQVQYGAGTSSATAGSLAGLGIKALGTTLNQSMAITTISLDYAFGVATDRAGAFVWTGGAGTLTLPLASNAGNDWFVNIRNSGTGAITVSPSGSDLINGDSSLIFNPGDSAIITCSGTAWYSFGFGQSADFTFDYDSIDLTAASNPYTLTGADLNRIAYNFGGAIASNFDIIVPATIQQYWVTNSTTGGFSITVKTLAGTGITISDGEASILYCNGTNVVDADTAGVSYPISVANGGTGATNATDARSNLSAAKSGVNADITQITALSDGGASSPAVTFLSEASTGLYRSGAGSLAFSILGTAEATLSATGLNLASGNAYSINGTSVLSSTALGSGVVSSSLTSVGTLTSGALGSGFTTVAVGQGGTGITTATANGVIYGNATSAFGVTAAGTTGQVLVGNTGSAPSWAALSSSAVTSISFGSTGLTPSVATQGPVTVGGTLAAANGGTGQSSYTTGDLLYASGATTLAKLADVATGNALLSGGVGVAPAWGKIGLTTHVSGTLPVANGGTGATSLTSGYLVKGNGTSAASASVVYDNGTNVGIGTSSPGVKFQIQQDQAAYSYFDYYNVTNGGGIVWRQIVRNLANTGTTSVDLAKLIGGGFVVNNNDTGASNYTAFGVGGTERMRITSAGNVGIGTTSPAGTLDVVRSAADAVINITSGSNTVQIFENTAGDAYLTNYASGRSIRFSQAGAGFINFGVNGSERMRIDSSGNVGIGTSSPASLLDVAGTIRSGVGGSDPGTGAVFYFVGSGAFQTVVGGAAFAVNTGANNARTERMRIDASGNVGIGTASPGSKLQVSGTVTATAFVGIDGGTF